MAWFLVPLIPFAIVGVLLYRRERRSSHGAFETPEERRAAAGRRSAMETKAMHTRGISNTNNERGGLLG
jgi:hypothetical protein